jgi:sortase A
LPDACTPGERAVPVITPSESPSGAAGELTLDSMDLCRVFVEEMLSEAQAVAARERPGQPVPEVDWTKIWQAGDGASSKDGAIGRIVRGAAEVAHHIAGRTIDVPVPPAGRHAIAPALAVAQPEPEPARKTTAAVAPVAAAAPSGTAVAPPVFPEPEPEPVPPATAAPMGDRSVPVDEPEVVATAMVESVVEPTTEQVPLVTPETEEGAPPVEMAEAEAPAESARKRRTADRTGWITVYTWMCMIGAIILLFVGWQLWGTSISQHHAQDQLKSQFDASVNSHHAPKATKSGPALTPAGENLPNPPDGTVIAHLQIPAIGLDEYVVSGSSASDLSKGPGHYVGTAMPGQAGNVAIAGHRTTNGAPFNRIGQLVPGDKVLLTTLTGEHLTYVVSAAPVSVSPRDVSVLNYFGDNRITLTTCTPEFSASQRLIVVGQLKEPAGTPAPAKDVTYHVANSANASWNWSLLPTVGIEVCLLLLLGLSYRYFGYWFEKTGRWIVLVPLWVAGLYLLFDSLTKFLPASL